MPHLEIEAIAFGGKGIAHLRDSTDKVWMVQDAIPGDIVEVEVVKEHRKYIDAAMIKIISPSPFRSPPPCLHADRCGGCNWQGVDYEQQLRWKSQFVADSLQRIGRITVEHPVTIHPSPQQLHYRARSLFRARVGSSGTIEIGFFARASRQLVPVKRCEIADPAINDAVAGLRAHHWSVTDLRWRMEIQSYEQGRISAVLTPGDGPSSAFRDLVAEIDALGIFTDVCASTDRPAKSSMHAFDRESSLRFLTQPGLFQQVNRQANHKLRLDIHRLAEKIDATRILDLYCGSGNLSLLLASQGRQVTGIETSQASIRCALASAAALEEPANGNYIAGDVAAWLRTHTPFPDPVDLVIADPPRQGMADAIDSILQLRPATIAYVSCDPATLARDLRRLCATHYVLKSIEAYDFFPQTYHVESVAILVKSSG